MANAKKLKLPNDIPVDKNMDNEVLNGPFIDMKDKLFSKEHYGYYVMYITSKAKTSRSPRLYLSKSHDTEYYNALKKKVKDKNIGKSPTKSKTYLFDSFKDQKEMVWKSLQLIISDQQSYDSLRLIIGGLKILLELLDHLNIQISSILEINNNLQVIIYKNFNPKDRNEENELSYFFHQLGKINPNFIPIETQKIYQYQNIEALPTNVAYQLDYYAKCEILEIMKNVNQIKQWREKAKQYNIFSKNNLTKTYLDLQKNILKNRKFSKVIVTLVKILYDEDLLHIHHRSLHTMAEGGINIEITSKSMFLLWHDKLFPDFPYNINPDPQYESLPFTRHELIRQYNHSWGEDIKTFYSYLFPSIQTIYPLILFLLIREGLNSETLQSWEITSKKNGTYTLGDSSPLASIIKGKKSRSNTILKTTIGANSDQKKFIDFYLDWLTPLYDRSNHNNFIQYLSNKYDIKVYGPKLYTYYDNSIGSLYSKYDIRDIDGTRLHKINHQRIRPYTNYADYMRGYKEFERQTRKGHKQINTQISYENSTEWKGNKNNKIAKTQDFVIEIFRGNAEDSSHHTAGLFQGILASCKNPKEPTFEGHSKIKNNEACGSYFKCLTQCDKSVVIPKIHGPTIYAWIEYMEQEKENAKSAMNILEWEKEYLVDYESALATVSGFTAEEEKYSKKNAHKSKWIMGKKFKNKLKIRSVINE